MKTIKFISKALILLAFFTSFSFKKKNSDHKDVLEIGNRREIFVDYYLIDQLKGVQIALHELRDEGPVLYFDNPWEGAFSAYCTIINDNGIYRAYYRGNPRYKDGSVKEVTCYAQSEDGIHWEKPDLGIFKINGRLDNNVILADAAPVTHNFSPFLDRNPDARPGKRYKALGGLSESGLIAYVSEDGIHWNNLQKGPVIIGRKNDFDSQNVSFWSEEEQLYVCYYRTWVTQNGKRYRSVARTTSSDFIHWTNPVEMSFGDTLLEQIYTNQTSPYFRAPHIYISVAARFMKNRQVISEEEAKRLSVNPNYYKDCSDAIFMTTRGGNNYDRTFMESFIRPGIGLQNWVSRSNYPALNIVQTGSEEMSVYINQNYAQPTAHLHRYSLRLDGFTSLSAGYEGGEVITKPFTFEGNELEINYATSAAGEIKFEILDAGGNVIPGFSLNDSNEIIGNEIKRIVSWNGTTDISKLTLMPIRLRIFLKDADLFSMKFAR